ncbi:MAG: Ig-like domain-containing protein [Chloroflexota bacterium]
MFLVALALILLAACETIAPPAPPTPAPTSTPEPPTNTPVRVAFPTVAPASAAPTIAASSTATITPSSSSARGTAPPVAQLVSPVSSAQISVGQTYNVVVYAADDNGVARVELSDDGALVRAENAPTPAPRVFSAIIPWTPTQSGAHALRVVAYDGDHRASAPDEVTVTVLQDARRPTSIIVYPIGTPQVDLGSILQIYGVATDDAGVTQVELWADNQMYTYLAAQNAGAQNAFPFVFGWNALAPGTHTFFVRARDNQDQTTDSTPLKVVVVDTHQPSLRLQFERTNAPLNEPITITVTALDVSGIQRIELWSGKEIFYTTKSANPARQTALTAQLLWTSANPGDYQIFARAYNANGNQKDAPAQTISILRPGQATPTPAPTITPTRPRAPRATPTARSQPPPPPTAEILSPVDRFSGSSPLRVTFAGRGNSELERIELWGYTQGQTQPQIICAIDAHASTQKTGQCDWNMPSAGVVSVFAQASDIYRQTARSTPITGYIGAPLAPSPPATPTATVAR